NKPAVSGCEDEPVEVGPLSPAISTTQLPASGPVGGTFKDKAKLTGLFEGASGTVSFKLFDNPKCEGTPVATDGPVSVSGNGEYEAPKGAVISSVGTYYWVASYSGDHNNKPMDSGCADEPVTVAAVEVLVEQVESGNSTAHGPTTCIAPTRPVSLYVKGRQIQSATFYMDGHKLK